MNWNCEGFCSRVAWIILSLLTFFQLSRVEWAELQESFFWLQRSNSSSQNVCPCLKLKWSLLVSQTPKAFEITSVWAAYKNFVVLVSCYFPFLIMQSFNEENSIRVSGLIFTPGKCGFHAKTCPHFHNFNFLTSLIKWLSPTFLPKWPSSAVTQAKSGPLRPKPGFNDSQSKYDSYALSSSGEI